MDIAEALRRPERLVVGHPLNPPHLVTLVEIVPGAKTSPETGRAGQGAEGVLTEAELDEIVASSIGLRWAVAGPFRTFHLGGSPGGLPHFIEHLGRAMEDSMWPALGDPTFDEATVTTLVDQAHDAFGAGTVEEPAAERDRAQITLTRALGQTPGSGCAHA